MNESTKASRLPSRRAIHSKYLQGRGIDVGCGMDNLGSSTGNWDFIESGLTVDGWDKDRGDAQFLEGIEKDTFDWLYSSHCLEHMESVPVALYNWSRVVKRHGHLVIVVPDFLMYERCQWPSPFNDDHRASFSVFDIPQHERHGAFYSVAQMIEMSGAAGLVLVDLRIEHAGYDFQALPYLLDQTAGNACANVVYVFRKL